MKSLTFLFRYFMLLQIYNDDYGSDGTLHYTIIGQYKFGTKINPLMNKTDSKQLKTLS
jgi:hypothetical protein